MSPLVQIMVLIHLQVGPSLYVSLKQAPQEIELPPQKKKLLPPFKGEHPEQAWIN